MNSQELATKVFTPYGKASSIDALDLLDGYIFGRLAQLVERLHHMEEVEGSNPLIAQVISPFRGCIGFLGNRHQGAAPGCSRIDLGSLHRPAKLCGRKRRI